jgi:hypothetical protein
MTVWLIVISIAIGAARPIFVVRDFNHHVEMSYQAAAHILVGVLLVLMVQRYPHAKTMFWGLVFIEVACAAISIAIKKGLLLGVLLAIACTVVASSRASAENALWQLNVQRSYFGLHPLRPDPRLQQVAEETCRIMASRRASGHIYGRPAAGKWEGTGHRSGADRLGTRFYTCYQNHAAARRAGAAYVVTAGQTFYVLLLE